MCKACVKSDDNKFFPAATKPILAFISVILFICNAVKDAVLMFISQGNLTGKMENSVLCKMHMKTFQKV